MSHELIDQHTHWINMNGRNVFKNAVVRFPQVINEVLEATGIAKDQVKLVVPHQANLRITEAVAHRLES